MAHALLSPSAAHRWLNCPAAPRLEEQEPDEGSSFAAEGTLAHAFCAANLKEYLGLSTKAEQEEVKRLRGNFEAELLEIVEHARNYAAFVIGRLNELRVTTPDATLLVEQQLDLRGIIPDAFGTADAIIVADGVLEVIDFKYGRGVKVDAFENPQMQIYALGALERYADEYAPNVVRMCIVQPRLGNYSIYETTATALQAWRRQELEPKAKAAYRGDGEAKAGSWCKFCKCSGKCRALKELAESVAGGCTDPRTLSPEEIATNVLPRIDIIEDWCKAVRGYALGQALAGEVFKGWKVVEGRSLRRITAPETLAERIVENTKIARDSLYKPRELMSIGVLEKMVGKAKFAELSEGCIDKPAGKPALVPESDKRPAFDSAANDFKDF